MEYVPYNFPKHMSEGCISSFSDLSSEFSGGMYLWFGEEWLDLKEKVLALVNIKQKKFEGVVKSDIDEVEKVCE